MRVGASLTAILLLHAGVSLAAERLTDPRTEREKAMRAATAAFSPVPNVGSDGCPVTPVTPPLTINGTLTTSSCISTVDSSLGDVYSIQGTAGQPYTVDYLSHAYNIFFVAKGDGVTNFDLCFGTRVSFLDSNNPPSGTSRVTANCTFAKSGIYYIHAESLWSAGDPDPNHPTTGPYTITITGGSGASGPPAITSFAASPPTIRAGQSATLSWVTANATSVTIDNGVGAVSASGSVTVKPNAKTTYTLTAMQGSSSVTATASVDVITTPIVNVTAFPAPMLQPANIGGATTSYTLTNSGGAAASLTLTQTGNFFTQSPTSFTLQPGGSQTITITGIAEPANSYDGTSNPSGVGSTIPVKLLSAAPPTGSVSADPGSTRVDVAASSGTNPTGSVTFTNHGTSTLTGILTSDVPWIIPQSGVVTIAPGQTVTLTFTIDRTKRPDSSALIGSAEGGLSLTFLSGSGSAQSFARRPFDNVTFIPSVSLVKVVDTVQTTVTSAGIPGLAAGEVALFVSGVGHVTGTKGVLFVSDVSLLNPQGSKSIDDVKFYYTPTTGSASSARTTSLPSVPGQVSVAVADVVKNVFSGNEEIGTMQIRSKDADKLVVAATILTANNAAGTFGNTIPVLRSDRSVAAGSALVLTGLRKDATTHTNIYVQETAGSAATVQIDFLGADGSTILSRPADSIDTFKVLQLPNVVPTNAVAAIVNNTSTAGGKIAAYATPVDESSSDTWAVADWSTQLGYTTTEATIIPVAGNVHGANNTFYRTDVAITNRGTSAASGTLRYISRSGDKIDRQISLGGKQSDIISDVIGTRFNVTGDTTGSLSFTPVTGSFAITSRTFATVGSSTATFGTGVPTLAAASALKAGGSRPIAGLADATRSTVVAARPGTFRTNFALMETTGQAVTVRVTFRFTFPAGQKAQGIGFASRDYSLNGNQFVMLNSIAGEILGPARLQFGDLTNVEADFQVLSGSGAVVLFTSSVDNATGDSILRTE